MRSYESTIAELEWVRDEFRRVCDDQLASQLLWAIIGQRIEHVKRNGELRESKFWRQRFHDQAEELSRKISEIEKLNISEIEKLNSQHLTDQE